MGEMGERWRYREISCVESIAVAKVKYLQYYLHKHHSEDTSDVLIWESKGKKSLHDTYFKSGRLDHTGRSIHSKTGLKETTEENYLSLSFDSFNCWID